MAYIHWRFSKYSLTHSFMYHHYYTQARTRVLSHSHTHTHTHTCTYTHTHTRTHIHTQHEHTHEQTYTHTHTHIHTHVNTHTHTHARAHAHTHTHTHTPTILSNLLFSAVTLHTCPRTMTALYTNNCNLWLITNIRVTWCQTRQSPFPGDAGKELLWITRLPLPSDKPTASSCPLYKWMAKLPQIILNNWKKPSSLSVQHALELVLPTLKMMAVPSSRTLEYLTTTRCKNPTADHRFQPLVLQTSSEFFKTSITNTTHNLTGIINIWGCIFYINTCNLSMIYFWWWWWWWWRQI